MRACRIVFVSKIDKAQGHIRDLLARPPADERDAAGPRQVPIPQGRHRHLTHRSGAGARHMSIAARLRK